jgi:transcriptional regulator with XRE-family HTH domain
MQQQVAAERLGRTKSSLSKIESGTAKTSLQFLQEYGDLVGVPVVALVPTAEYPHHELAIRLAALESISPEALRTLSALVSLWEDAARERQRVSAKAV